MTTSTEAQLKTGHFHSSNHQNLLPCQFPGGETVKNIKIDPQTTNIWSKKVKRDARE